MKEENIGRILALIILWVLKCMEEQGYDEAGMMIYKTLQSLMRLSKSLDISMYKYYNRISKRDRRGNDAYGRTEIVGSMGTGKWTIQLLGSFKKYQLLPVFCPVRFGRAKGNDAEKNL